MSIQKVITYSYCKRKFFLKYLVDQKEGFSLKQVKAGIISSCLRADNVKEELKKQLKKNHEKFKTGDESLVSVFTELLPMIQLAKKYKNTLTKYGSSPKFGVWDTDRLLLTNYMINNDLKESGMLYLKDKEHRIIVNNPFAEKKLKRIEKEVKNFEEKQELPQILEDKSKCENCSYKGLCHDEEAVRKLVVKS